MPRIIPPIAPPLLAALLTLPAALPAQTGPQAGPRTVPPGRWEIRSTIAELDVPGVPGFLRRMAIGHAQVERKCVPTGQTIAALLAPDPKAQCRVDRLEVGAGRYAQALTCPQKNAGPMTVARAGSYDAAGFAGRATVTGTTAKGTTRIALDQRAVRVAGACAG